MTADVSYDVESVRREFPILATRVHGHPLVFLDSAASAQRPQTVIDAVVHYETTTHANVHRGVHWLSQRATDAFEAARKSVQRFINAASEREVIFTRGTTEGINLVAQAWGRANVSAGDEILITAMEHHSNIVPWQMLRDATGATLRVAPIDLRGELDLTQFNSLLNSRTRMVALTHVSNALGTVLPVQELTAHVRRLAPRARVLIDGAQAAPHQRIDVRTIDCDFYVFSGHKVYGPTGIGVLYGREAVLTAMPPWQGGGEMISTVSFERSTWADLPAKFEAGTPNVSGAVGLGAALDWLTRLGIERVHAHEQFLMAKATAALRTVPGLTLVGTANKKSSVISFVLDGIHAHDLGTIVDAEGVAIRTGHHCAMPLMTFFKLPATARASFGCYSNEADIDALVRALLHAREVFG
jgi:cysteine desulfurase / selenocysteine lyase